MSAGSESAQSRQSESTGESQPTLIFSTLFLARDMEHLFGTAENLQKTIGWCRRNGLGKVYLETYRGTFLADRQTISRARDAFQDAGFEVDGCVTTTRLGKPSMSMIDGQLAPDKHLACYSDPETRQILARISAYTAELFDRIIIDDFFNTLCQCAECTAAKGERSWPDYRAALMREISEECVIAPARQANPRVRMTIKFPNYYDHWLSSGYDLEHQRELFDAVYTGTETREPAGPDSNPQYGAYFIMQLLNAAAGIRNEGGWFDYIDTAPATFVEQARQTVLGQAPEIMLFHGRVLMEVEKEIPDMAALRSERAGLLKLSALLKGRLARGVAAPKPFGSSDLHLADSRIGADRYLFSFLGMLGIPLQPQTGMDGQPLAQVATRHLLYDQAFLESVLASAKSGVPTLMSSNLAREIGIQADGVPILPFSNKTELMQLPADALDRLRNQLLAPLGVELHSPLRVALYLYDEDLAVLENFNDQSVEVRFRSLLGCQARLLMSLPEDANAEVVGITGEDGMRITLPARSLVVIGLDPK